MNTNNFLRQFVKDGLIGLAVVFLAFAVLLVMYLGVTLNLKVYSSTKEFWLLNWSLISQLFVFPKFLSIANGQRLWHVFFQPNAFDYFGNLFGGWK